MCPGTDDYYKTEESFRNGRLAVKTRPSSENGPQTARGREGVSMPQQDEKALGADVDSPMEALQVLLRKVILDIRSESETYAQVAAQQRQTATEAQVLQRQREGLKAEEADVRDELERTSNQQSDLIHSLAAQQPLPPPETPAQAQPVQAR